MATTARQQQDLARMNDDHDDDADWLRWTDASFHRQALGSVVENQSTVFLGAETLDVNRN
jgi:hypothetical protein